MTASRTRFSFLPTILPIFLALTLFTTAAATASDVSTASGRYIAVAKDANGYEALRADLVQAGAKVLADYPQIDMLVVRMPVAMRATAEASAHIAGLARDHVATLNGIAGRSDFVDPALAGKRITVDLTAASGTAASTSANTLTANDPALSYPGLMWNFRRIHAPKAWRSTTGSPVVKVGVADTGVDFTHSELASKITEEDVFDFTTLEDPPLCLTNYGKSDADLAAEKGGPATTDWNGHGTWIAGNIAAALDGAGIQGIAPTVQIVPLKISGWCGQAYDSVIIGSILHAAGTGIDIVSISFGGYFDRSDPDDELLYQKYADAVKHARSKGTLVVSSAGNDHVKIGAGGKVLSHGSLTTPGDELVDLYGWYNVPSGIPGVVMVSSTGNVVRRTSQYCLDEDAESANATCKPKSDRHQPYGVGKIDQLAYYSNYGPRVDVAAPGGARKFNLPNYERGGTPGWPVTENDGTAAFEEFSITSNWAQDIPCYTFVGGGFPADQCYSTIQGTSMATPHVSAALALIVSANPTLRYKPKELVTILKSGARPAGPNLTPPLRRGDKSRGDYSLIPCATGYCHLGGDPISDRDAYGAGIIDLGALHGAPLSEAGSTD